MKDKEKKKKIDKFLDKRMEERTEAIGPEYTVENGASHWIKAPVNISIYEPICKISYTEEEVKELLQKYSNDHSNYQWEGDKYVCKSNNIEEWFNKNKKSK